MTTCEACRNTMGKDLTFYKFPLEEERLQKWITSIGKSEGWTPSESSVLCSAHFSPECFDDSTHLRSDATPTIFSPSEFMEEKDLKEPENLTNDQGTSAGALDIQRSMCDCEERVQAIEKSYRQKLLTAQLQIKKYQKELAEQSHKVMKWQRRAIVLQSAVKALKLRRPMLPTGKSPSSDKCTDLAENGNGFGGP